MPMVVPTPIANTVHGLLRTPESGDAQAIPVRNVMISRSPTLR